MRILYKILFEVKVLHEYYLTNPPDDSIFSQATPQGRMQFLLARYSEDVASVNEDLSFLLTREQVALFRNYHLVLINSYSGFQVAAEVSSSKLPDGSTVYEPLVPLPDDLNLLIGISENRPFMDQITNGRLNTAVQAARYFSNEKVFDPKEFPCLSSPLQPTTAGYPYEQGELASFGPGDIRAYYYYDVGNPPLKDQWLPVPGDGFSGEQDRIVVAPRFYYLFAAGDAVSSAVFELKDGNGQSVDTRSVGNTMPLGMVLLDYSALLRPRTDLQLPPVLKTLPANKMNDGILYTLTVTGDNGYSRTMPLIFYYPDADEVPGSYWGWIHLQRTVSDASFNLLDGAGRLFTRIQPDGTITLHPVFEIRLKSRFTFWRWKNDEGKTLLAPGATIAPMVDLINGEWVSKTPRFVTYRPTYFLNPNDNMYYFLPNPESDTLAEVSRQQFFSNIPVPQSTKFPVS